MAPCGPREGFEAFCPFGSSLLQVSLGGGGDTFATEDDTVNPGDHRCRPAQDSAALRLDGGARDDLVRATPLADTIELGPGNDGVDSFGGDDTVNGGAGVDLIQTYDGSDVADGGTGRQRVRRWAQ